MKSDKLKADRNDFTDSIDKYIESYQEFQTKIKTINAKIVDFDDKMLADSILEKNEELGRKLKALVSELQSCKTSVVNSVNAKIIDLMEEERNQLEVK